MNYEWVKLYFQTQLESWLKLLGAEVGDGHRREREQMRAYVDEQSRLIGNLIELRAKNLEAQIESQRRTIEVQEKQIKAMLSRLAARKKEPEIIEQ